MSQIFFSYSRRDSEFVDKLIADLEARGVSIWIDRGEILAGESWRYSIVEAIRKCQVFIIVLSPDAVKSENVAKELTLAEQYDKRVLPLLISPVEIPPAMDYQLAGLQYQTFAEGDYEGNFELLIRALIATGIPAQPKNDSTAKANEAFPAVEPIQKISSVNKLAPSIARETPSENLQQVRKSSDNPLKKVPVWLWAGAGAVIVIGMLLVLFSFVGRNFSDQPTTTIGVAEALNELSTPLFEDQTATQEAVEKDDNSSTVTPASTLTEYPPLITDDFGFPMVLVDEGPFLLGATNEDPDEQPIVEIELKGFYIDQFEVSNASYQKCVDLGICDPPQQFDSQTRSNYYGTSEFANYPVIHVSWEDAAVFCAWRGGRLPTEAEWEKAARGPSGWKYPWGNEFDANRANYCGGSSICPNESDDGYADTAPVDAFKSGASPYGAYQMAGNVNEWVADWYDKNYYASLEDGVENPLGPENGQERGIRGGSFGLNAQKLRATNRGFADPLQSSEYDGFRCASDLP